MHVRWFGEGGARLLAFPTTMGNHNEWPNRYMPDVLRELLNMTAGQIKAELALDQALGLPRVVEPDGLLAAGAAWHHTPLVAGDVVLMLSLAECLL